MKPVVEAQPKRAEVKAVGLVRSQVEEAARRQVEDRVEVGERQTKKQTIWRSPFLPFRVIKRYYVGF